MILKDYFEPHPACGSYRFGENNSFGGFTSGYHSKGRFPEWADADIAIIGLSEYRHACMGNSPLSANQARESLYGLSPVTRKMKIADLGNLREGKSIEDSIAGLRDVLAELTAKGTLPLIIGGTREMAHAMFQSYEKNKQTINLTLIDSLPGLAALHYDGTTRKSLLSSIISSRSKYLFNYTNIGYQTHFAGTDETATLEELLFDAFRVGKVRGNISEMEPVLRDTDLLLVSMSSVRQNDAPASLFPSPNGFTAEEACQLAWYGGLSERVSSMAITDWSHEYDSRYHTAHLAAQIAWYFVDGFYKRKGEFPFNTAKNCTKYIVDHAGTGTGITFYKSTLSDRWWMEVPSSKLPAPLLVSCSYEDYRKACRQEVPDRWWQNFKKINH